VLAVNVCRTGCTQAPYCWLAAVGWVIVLVGHCTRKLCAPAWQRNQSATNAARPRARHSSDIGPCGLPPRGQVTTSRVLQRASHHKTPPPPKTAAHLPSRSRVPPVGQPIAAVGGCSQVLFRDCR